MALDRLLARLVVTSLTIFIVLIILLGALFFRQLGLQQVIADSGMMLQESVGELEKTTSELQDELTDIRTASQEGEIVGSLENVTELLGDVDEQLDAAGSAIHEVDVVLEQSLDLPPSENDAETSVMIQDSLDQVFTLVVLLIGSASIAIAILWGLALRVRQRSTENDRLS